MTRNDGMHHTFKGRTVNTLEATAAVRLIRRRSVAVGQEGECLTAQMTDTSGEGVGQMRATGAGSGAFEGQHIACALSVAQQLYA